MITVLALLCATSLSHAQCDRASAQDFIYLGKASSIIECQMASQMTLANLAIEAGEGYRWVVKCTRTSIGKTVG